MTDIPDTWKGRIETELRRAGIEDETEWEVIPDDSLRAKIRMVTYVDNGMGKAVDIDIPKGMETRRFYQKLANATTHLENYYLENSFLV